MRVGGSAAVIICRTGGKAGERSEEGTHGFDPQRHIVAPVSRNDAAVSNAPVNRDRSLRTAIGGQVAIKRGSSRRDAGGAVGVGNRGRDRA